MSTATPSTRDPSFVQLIEEMKGNEDCVVFFTPRKSAGWAGAVDALPLRRPGLTHTS